MGAAIDKFQAEAAACSCEAEMYLFGNERRDGGFQLRTLEIAGNSSNYTEEKLLIAGTVLAAELQTTRPDDISSVEAAIF